MVTNMTNQRMLNTLSKKTMIAIVQKLNQNKLGIPEGFVR